ncbi:hypothetical protein A6E15_11430 [Natrinema saccharevitans]|uniref:DUF7409 domain-containing protein n=1 Tax=Natrinema saccharevitans TaxID=301967 RepID=A0A1S8B111_9EURY|nr:hypothetical protein [Natrinema saccharevitans]OLZ42703.1 hypothetical protein A6E15_11430 [Natrinema saccharevitans]
MSKEEVASDAETGTAPASDGEGGDATVVDIGITVDVGDDAAAVGSDPVELAFDEDELLAAADDATTDTDDEAPAGSAPDAAIDPAEREALADAGVDPDAVVDKEYSYRLLLEDGVDEDVAAALRRRFSLPWSFESDGDLQRRSSEVRGLGAAEREWIAVSDDEDWQAFEYDEEGVSVGRNRPDERPYPKPTPVAAVTGVGPDDADRLAEAGVQSAERLATVDAMTVAKALDLNVLHVRTWRHSARELLE